MKVPVVNQNGASPVSNGDVLAGDNNSYVNLLCFTVSCVLMLLGLIIAALWQSAGKGLTSWLLLVMLIVFFVTFPCGILGQVLYLIVSFPDLCLLSYFK